VECGVWSVECGVWSVECGVWSVERGVFAGDPASQAFLRSKNLAAGQIHSARGCNIRRGPPRGLPRGE